MSEHPPMLLQLKPIKYIYPDVSRDRENLVFSKGSVIHMFCPGKTNRDKTKVIENGDIKVFTKTFSRKKNSNPGTSTLIECLGINKFKLQNQAGIDLLQGTAIDDFKAVSCVGHQKGIHFGPIIKETNKNCLEKYDGNGKSIAIASISKIGYDLQLPTNEFLETIELCHDKSTKNTLWAHSVIIPANQRGARYPLKKEFNVRDYYVTSNQLKTAAKLLNNNHDLLKKYFLGPEGKVDKTFPKTGRYFDIGHLIAKADKFHESEQSSTFFFENALPMWNAINRGIWSHIEDRIRRIAGDKSVVLDIWVGGIGVLELENVPFYLKPGSPNQVPVPKILYKVVIDTYNKEALVFLTVNNPNLSDSEVEDSKDEYIVCKTFDNCRDKLFTDSYEAKGYYYCCVLNDFYGKHAKNLGLLEKLEEYKDYSALTWSSDLFDEKLNAKKRTVDV
ncbi:hypothetical protein TSAR_015216 [Trichomalopsis sarcophagae]|uniref:DNA/RNA non-specific endonuclease domain-containing protein n=1 Tax=Trichomalopsis sarcophagae TaxID=543379 RepID=A0A232FDV7_9HYME|nr:hypothetical protein TSAR_015216 [Trichomalopsis sarcophagae]